MAIGQPCRGPYCESCRTLARRISGQPWRMSLRASRASSAGSCRGKLCPSCVDPPTDASQRRSSRATVAPSRATVAPTEAKYFLLSRPTSRRTFTAASRNASRRFLAHAPRKLSRKPCPSCVNPACTHHDALLIVPRPLHGDRSAQHYGIAHLLPSERPSHQLWSTFSAVSSHVSADVHVGLSEAIAGWFSRGSCNDGHAWSRAGDPCMGSYGEHAQDRYGEHAQDRTAGMLRIDIRETIVGRARKGLAVRTASGLARSRADGSADVLARVSRMLRARSEWVATPERSGGAR
jgi:hypothetical protein